MTEPTLDYRGYLLHLSHYDPRWIEHKPQEKPFSLPVASDVLQALAEQNFNLLIIDCSDGVRYASHPELVRHYSVPMDDLAALVDLARKAGLQVVPKLNFAKSPRHQHDTWMRPHSVGTGYSVDDAAYWKVAGEVIDELVRVCRPESFFHIGMDEDDERTLPQYVQAVHMLRYLVGTHGLRTMMWSDACSIKYDHPEYSKRGRRAADSEKVLEHDIVQIIWNYRQVFPDIVQRITRAGFDLWVAPSANPEQVAEWKRLLVAEAGVGLLMTHWVSCIPENRDAMLERIRTAGPAYA